MLWRIDSVLKSCIPLFRSFVYRNFWFTYPYQAPMMCNQPTVCELVIWDPIASGTEAPSVPSAYLSCWRLGVSGYPRYMITAVIVMVYWESRAFERVSTSGNRTRARNFHSDLESDALTIRPLSTLQVHFKSWESWSITLTWTIRTSCNFTTLSLTKAVQEYSCLNMATTVNVGRSKTKTRKLGYNNLLKERMSSRTVIYECTHFLL